MLCALLIFTCSFFCRRSVAALSTYDSDVCDVVSRISGLANLRSPVNLPPFSDHVTFGSIRLPASHSSHVRSHLVGLPYSHTPLKQSKSDLYKICNKALKEKKFQQKDSTKNGREYFVINYFERKVYKIFEQKKGR